MQMKWSSLFSKLNTVIVALQPALKARAYLAPSIDARFLWRAKMVGFPHLE